MTNNPDAITKNFSPENKQILQSIINNYKNADNVQVKWQHTIKINAVAARPSMYFYGNEDASFAPYYQNTTGLVANANSFVTDVNEEVSKGQWTSGNSYEVTLFVPTSLADERFYDKEDIYEKRVNAEVPVINKDKPTQDVPYDNNRYNPTKKKY